MNDWQPIETAPELERVFVAGWERRSGRVDGYWWWHEDHCYEGKAIEHPNATMWCPINLPPLPEPPKDSGQ